MNVLPVDQVDNVEEFVFSLAMCAVSVESLYKLAQRGIKQGMLEIDEAEQAETIMHESRRVFHSIDGLINIMKDRANIDASHVAALLKQKLIEAQHGVVTSDDNPRRKPRAVSVGDKTSKKRLPTPRQKAGRQPKGDASDSAGDKGEQRESVARSPRSPRRDKGSKTDS